MRPLQKAPYGPISLSSLNRNPRNTKEYSCGYDSARSSILSHIRPFAEASHRIYMLACAQTGITVHGLRLFAFHGFKLLNENDSSQMRELLGGQLESCLTFYMRLFLEAIGMGGSRTMRLKAGEWVISGPAPISVMKRVRCCSRNSPLEICHESGY
jgi:hypothetical protein